MASVSAMSPFYLFSADRDRSTLRLPRDADADRHAGSALPARAGDRQGALAASPSTHARAPSGVCERPLLRRRVPRAAVRHVRADDRRDAAVLRRRARAAAHRRRALEQPAVASATRFAAPTPAGPPAAASPAG